MISSAGSGSGNSTVTVLIPTFNRSAWLRELLEATLGQTRVPDVVLVADNGSTDDTEAVVAEFAADGVVRHLRRAANIDPILNENEALARVDTDYVVIVADDDRIYPNFIRETAAVLDTHPGVAIAHTRFDVIDQDGSIVIPDIDLVRSSDGAIESGATFVRRHMIDRWRVGFALARTDALRSVGFQVVENRADWLTADMVMWMEVAVRWDVAFIPSTLAGFRIHPNTLTATNLGFRGEGYALSRETPDQYLDVRTRFVERRRAELEHPDELLKLARRSWRLDRIDYISQSTFPERRRRTVLSELASAVRRDPRVGFEIVAWKLLFVSLAGQTLSRHARRLKGLRASTRTV